MSEMKEFKSGAIREDKTGKGRMDLLPMCALMRVAHHMERSLKDHPERNWEKGIPMHSFLDSALRHLFRYMDGQDDEDHLCSAAWNILCAMWTEEKRPEMQDIPTRMRSQKPSDNREFTLDMICSSFVDRDIIHPMDGRCLGTKDIDPCNCGGMKRLCNFYPDVRESVLLASSCGSDAAPEREHPETDRGQEKAKEGPRRANAEQG